MPEEIDQLVQRIQKLDLNQQRIINELIDELIEDTNNVKTDNARGTVVGPNTGIRTQRKLPNHNFISKDGVPLSVGDRVEVLTTRKVGRSGDIAQIDQFNKKYVAITILASGRSTQRDSKYLNFIE